MWNLIQHQYALNIFYVKTTCYSFMLNYLVTSCIGHLKNIVHCSDAELPNVTHFIIQYFENHIYGSHHLSHQKNLY